MVGHDHKFIYINMCIMVGKINPHILYHFADFRQSHLPINYIPEAAASLMGADGGEIISCLAVIIAGQAGGFTRMMF